MKMLLSALLISMASVFALAAATPLVSTVAMAASKSEVPVATLTCHSETQGTFQWFQKQGRAVVTDPNGEIATDLSGLAVGKTKRIGNMVVTYIVFADEDQTEVFGEIQTIGSVKQVVVLQETYICK